MNLQARTGFHIWFWILLLLANATFSEHPSAIADDRSLAEENGGNTEGQGGGEGEGEGEGEGGDEGEGGEEGEGEEEEEEEEEKPDKASIAGAVLFMNCIVIGMVLLCLVNSKYQGIQSRTWKLVNAVLTVFLAVLYHSAEDAVFDEAFGEEENEKSDSGGRIAAAMGGFAIWGGVVLVFNICWCRNGWGESRSFDGVNQILAHICSFACKEFLNAVMHADPFDENAGFGFLAVIILLACQVITGVALRFICAMLVPSESADIISEKLTEMQIDVTSVSVGFGLVQIVRFAEKRKLPSAELVEATGDHDTAHSLALVGLALLAFVLSLVVLKVQLILKTKNLYVESLKMTCVLTSAWFWIFWGDLQIVPVATESKFLGLMTMSSIYSSVVVGLTVGTELLLVRLEGSSMSEGLEMTMDLWTNAGSWMVALPWEQTFDLASEAVAADMGWAPWVTRLCTSITLAVVMTPSWFWHVLPNAISEESEENEKMLAQSSSTKATKTGAVKISVFGQPGVKIRDTE